MTMITFGELLLKARRNEDEEVLAKVTSKASSVETEAKESLEEKVEKLLAVAKSGQMEKGKDKRDRSRTPKSTPTNSEQNTPMKKDRERDVRTNVQGPRINASGPLQMIRSQYSVLNVRDGGILEGCVHPS